MYGMEEGIEIEKQSKVCILHKTKKARKKQGILHANWKGYIQLKSFARVFRSTLS